MIPVSIVLNNFCSFRGEHTILLSRGLTQITGRNLDNEGASSNRSGKTSLLNALSVCLYGRSPLVARSKGFINDQEKWAFTQVNFDNGITIKRFIKHPEYGNKILQGKNGCNFIEVTQEAVDKVFGSWDGFIASRFFGTNYSDFLEKILRKPAEAKELLTSLIPKLQVFDSALEWVKQQVSICEESLRELALEESNIQGKIQSLSSIDSEGKKNRFEEDRARELDRILKCLRMDEIVLEELGNVGSKEQLIKEQLATSKSLGVLGKEISELNRSLGIESSKLKTIGRQIEDINARIDSVVQSGDCPECGQPLPKKSSLSKEYEEKLKTLSAEKTKATKNYDKWYTEVELKTEQRKKFEDTDVSLREMLKPIIRASELKESISKWKQEYLKEESKVNSYIEQQARVEEEIGVLSLRLLGIEKSRKKFQELQLYYNFWIKGFGPRGIKNFVFDEIVFRLTELAKEYLDFMTNGTIKIDFSPRKEKKSGGFIETIGLEIFNQGWVLDDFLLWSQGERKRISLCVDLAMNRLLSEMFDSPLNFLVLDEAFDGLDRVGIETFVALLRNELKRVPMIPVVSHSPYAEELFDQQIVVLKEGGQSRILNNGDGVPRVGRLRR